jgi:hypothetical protein
MYVEKGDALCGDVMEGESRRDARQRVSEMRCKTTRGRFINSNKLKGTSILRLYMPSPWPNARYGTYCPFYEGHKVNHCPGDVPCGTPKGNNLCP